MRAIIDNIINSYDMQTKALGTLVASTERALEQLDREKEASKQTERIKNLVKGLTMDLNNMLTKFYFYKEHKNGRYERMTKGQEKALVDFVNFVKDISEKVRQLLTRFQKTETFEEKIEKELRQLDGHVKRKLKGFDDALSENDEDLVTSFGKYAQNLARWIAELFKACSAITAVVNRCRLNKNKRVNKSKYHFKAGSTTGPICPSDSRSEDLFKGLKVGVASTNDKPKHLTHSKV